MEVAFSNELISLLAFDLANEYGNATAIKNTHNIAHFRCVRS
jgi:hypothetical protein